jgi:hypothetical protein
MATTPIPISEVSPNFVGSSVSLCDQSLIPSPADGTDYRRAIGWCMETTVVIQQWNRAQLRQVVAHV